MKLARNSGTTKIILKFYSSLSSFAEVKHIFCLFFSASPFFAYAVNRRLMLQTPNYSPSSLFRHIKSLYGQKTTPHRTRRTDDDETVYCVLPAHRRPTWTCRDRLVSWGVFCASEAIRDRNRRWARPHPFAHG